MNRAAKDDLVSQLVGITGCEPDFARDILEGCGYDIQMALGIFYDGQPHARDNEQRMHGRDPVPAEPARPAYPVHKTGWESEPTTNTKSPTSTSGRSKHNYTSFEDLNPDFNKQSNDDKKKSLYTGGSASGLEVGSSAVHITVYRNGILVDGTAPLIPTVGNDAAAVEGREILAAMERKEIHPVLAERIKDMHKDTEADELDVEVEKRLDEDYKEASTPSQRVAFQGEGHHLAMEDDDLKKRSGKCKIVPIDLGGNKPDVRLKVSMSGAPPRIIEALHIHKLTDVMRHIGFVPKRIIRRSDNTEIDRANWTRSLRHLDLNGQVLLFE